MIKFAVPGMYEHYNIIIPLCSLLKTHPEYFNDNIEIQAVYGNFQFSVWDGGRIFTEGYKHATKEVIEKLIHIYNQELQIPIRLIFTTALEDKNICYSHFDNLVCTLCHNSMNEIVVSSSTLENYLRKTYPDFSFISSTTKCLSKDDAAEELKSDYKYVCLDYNLNKNQNFLNNIPQEQKNKIEFLVNAICPPGCPSRKKHYLLNSLFNYNYGETYRVGQCGITKSVLFPLNHYNNLSYNDIVEYYNNGFNNFKLEGRTFPPNTLILELVKYLVKPEYQFYIAEFLLKIYPEFDINYYSLERFSKIAI